MIIESELSRKPLVGSLPHRAKAIWGGHERANTISR
jgi:hypothetical protein